MSTAFGPYIGAVVAANFADRPSSGGDAAKLQSWMLPLRHTRIVFAPEFKKGATVNGVAIKLFEGGDTVVARANYKDEVSFRLAAKLVLIGNDDLEIEPADTKDTALEIVFPNKFVSRVSEGNRSHRLGDPTIKERYSEGRFLDAFTWIILNSFKGNVPPLAAQDVLPPVDTEDDCVRFLYPN